MPELPEVETVKNDLLKSLKNKKIISVQIKVPKMAEPRPPEFENKLKGQKILDIKRRGKLLIFTLTNNYLLGHMKMTGQFVFRPKKGKLVSGGHDIAGVADVPNKYTHAIIEMENGNLYFNDLRKFGYLKYVDQEKLDKILSEYGVEPLSKEFSYKKFLQILGKTPNKKIKVVLLDQALIAGIGNIYSDEICFFARVRPDRIVKSLSDKEKKDLFSGIKKILKKGVEQRGTSVNTYLDGSGKPGNFAKYLKVYQCCGEKCGRCKKGVIEKIKIGGRSSHFCSKCQK